MHIHAFAQPANDENFLINLEKKRSEAIAAKNADFLNNLYDENFYGVTVLGMKVNKKALLQLFANFKSENKVGPEDITAKVYGQSGITQGRLVTRNGAGEMVAQSLFMHFYAKRKGKWVLIAGQGAALQEK